MKYKKVQKNIVIVFLTAAVAFGAAACGNSAVPKSTDTGAAETDTEASADDTEKNGEPAGGSEEDADSTKIKPEIGQKNGEESPDGQTADTEKEVPEDSGEFTMGTWDGLTFTNPWLQLEFIFPEGSYIATEEEIQEVIGAGTEALVNDGLLSDSQVKAAEFTTGYDFLVRLPGDIANFQLMYENVSVSTLGKGISEEDYQDILVEKFLKIEDYGFEVVGKEKVDVGGQTFSKLSMSALGGAMYQDYYCLAKGKYMVCIVATYNPEYADPAAEVLGNIRTVQ